MTRQAFRMKLHKGFEAEYQRRHDAIWPELRELLRQTGIRNYSIFLDPETSHLFGVLELEDPAGMITLPDQPVMRKWWEYMKDIMETNPDSSPHTIPLEEVFHLP